MKKIFKYSFSPMEYKIELAIPQHSKILSYQMQGEEACLWVLVYVGEPNLFHLFRQVETGTKLEEPIGNYIGTIQHDGLVSHLFEIRTWEEEACG